VAVHLRLPRTSAASGADAEALKDAELSGAEARSGPTRVAGRPARGRAKLRLRSEQPSPGERHLRGRTRRWSQPCRSRPGRAFGRPRSAGSQPRSPPCGPPRGRRRGRRGLRPTSASRSRMTRPLVAGGTRTTARNQRGRAPLTATSFALTVTDNRPMSSLVSVIGSADTTRRPLGISIAHASSPIWAPRRAPGGGPGSSASRRASRPRGIFPLRRGLSSAGTVTCLETTTPPRTRAKWSDSAQPTAVHARRAQLTAVPGADSRSCCVSGTDAASSAACGRSGTQNPG
jgi:hypothetical protein